MKIHIEHVLWISATAEIDHLILSARQFNLERKNVYFSKIFNFSFKMTILNQPFESLLPPWLHHVIE